MWTGGKPTEKVSAIPQTGLNTLKWTDKTKTNTKKRRTDRKESHAEKTKELQHIHTRLLDTGRKHIRKHTEQYGCRPAQQVDIETRL